jgi:hypothetical protein
MLYRKLKSEPGSHNWYRDGTTDWTPEALWFKSHYGPNCPDQLWGLTHPPILLFNG